MFKRFLAYQKVVLSLSGTYDSASYRAFSVVTLHSERSDLHLSIRMIYAREGNSDYAVLTNNVSKMKDYGDNPRTGSDVYTYINDFTSISVQDYNALALDGDEFRLKYTQERPSISDVDALPMLLYGFCTDTSYLNKGYPIAEYGQCYNHTSDITLCYELYNSPELTGLSFNNFSGASGVGYTNKYMQQAQLSYFNDTSGVAKFSTTQTGLQKQRYSFDFR